MLTSFLTEQLSAQKNFAENLKTLLVLSAPEVSKAQINHEKLKDDQLIVLLRIAEMYGMKRSAAPYKSLKSIM